MELWAAIAGIPHIGVVLPYLGAGVLVCAALSPVLPPGKAGTVYGTVRQVIRWVGLNLGHAVKENIQPEAKP